jgi:hypothetical protein
MSRWRSCRYSVERFRWSDDGCFRGVVQLQKHRIFESRRCVWMSVHDWKRNRSLVCLYQPYSVTASWRPANRWMTAARTNFTEMMPDLVLEVG